MSRLTPSPTRAIVAKAANPMAYVDVRHGHTGKLLFRFDPGRNLIEIVDRGQQTVVDLSQYRVESPTPTVTVPVPVQRSSLLAGSPAAVS